MVPSFVIPINMPTMALIRLITIFNNTPCSFGGKQHLETLVRYIIPLSICSVKPYMDMSPPTPVKLDSYPHVFFTSDMEWSPQSIVDEYTIHDMDLSDNVIQNNKYHPNTMNAYGDLLPAAR
jgi:hypothetical protein